MRREAKATLYAVAVLAVAATVSGTYVARRPDRPSLTVAELTAYQDAVLPPLREGGRVVQEQMRPAAHDLPDATGAAAARIADEALAWERQLTTVRQQVAAVRAPKELSEASRTFDRALARYIDAARQFRTAAMTPRPSRQPVLATGYDTATDADNIYDAASAVLQRWRRRLGLGATPDFPDPTPTGRT